MASVSSNSAEALVVGGWTADEEQSNSDRYLVRRLEAAGADFKGVALTNFLLAAAVAAAIWLALGVLAEHWIVAGGLPRGVRWGWLAAGGLALVGAAVRWLLPLVLYRVNLVYAARAIEREHPELHNDLVNTVLVKAHPEGNTAVVVRSLEKRAAKRLADVPTDGVIDRTLAVRLAMLLAALVGLACLYELVAPKSLLISAVRLVAPWAGVAAPSRVRVDPPRLHWRMPGAGVVDPQFFGAGPEAQEVVVDRGSATLVRGRQLVLAAAVRGLRGDEQPVVHVVPVKDDGSHDPAGIPWRIDMVRGAGEGEAARSFTAFLPDAVRGLENSIELTIAAGDARSEPVRLIVVDAPSLLVREARYDFPAYIARAPETVAWQGDLKAPEETQVTLIAECNQPIDAAWIDFACDGQRDLKMKVGASDLTRASVTFQLRMNADRTAPEHATYRLLFQPRGANQAEPEAIVTEPMEHRIEVVADLAPEVTIESPTDSPLAAPRDAPVPVRVRALDPDHGLSRVVIETRIDGGRALPPMPLLEVAKQGPFKGTARLVPFNLGAEAGSVLQYRAVATDNRPQQPNVSVTPWQELRIDEKAAPQPDEPEPDLPNDSKKGRQGEDRSDESDRADDGGDAEQDGGAEPENGRDQDRQDRQGGDGDGAEDGAGQRRPDDGRRDDGASGDQDQQNPNQNQDQQNQDQQNQDPQQRGARADRKRPDRQRSDDGSNPPPPGEQGQPGASGGGDEQQGDGKQQRPGNDQSPKGSKPGKNGSPQQGADGGDSGDQQGSGQKPGSQQKGNAGKEPAQAGDDEGQGEGQQREGGEKPQPGAKPSPSGGAGKKRQNDAVAADGTNDGEAMDRILEHQRRESERGEAGETVKRQPKEGQKGEGQKGEGQKGEGQKGEGQKGEGQQGEGQQGEGQQGEGQQGEGQQGESQQGEGQQGEGQKGEGQKGEGQKGEGQQGEGQQGEGQQGEGQQGEGQQGEGQQGEGQKGEGQKGEGQKGEGQKGEGQKGEGQKGEGQKGEGQQGEGQQGEGQQGEGQKGEGQKGEGQKGEGQQGEGQKGEGQKGEGQQGEGQQGEGQQGEGQQGEGQQGEGQQGEGQKGEGQKGEGQKGEGQKGEGQKGEGQKGEGQKGEGQKGEGQKGEGQKGEGQKGEGQKGEGQKGEGQKGEGQQGEGQQGEGQQGEGQQGEGEGSGGEGEQGEGGKKPGGKAKPGGDRSQTGPKPPSGSDQAGGAQEGDQEGGGGAEPDQPHDGQPGSAASPTGRGGWSNGDGTAPDKEPSRDGDAPKTEAEWGDQDTAHARNAADLAVRGLKDDLDKGRTDLLDELGWTQDQARAFLQRWEAMRSLEKSNDPVKRSEFERAVRSLGLRAEGARSTRDVPADVKGGQAEGRRSRPPSEYREQFKAYTQGTTGE